MLMQAQHDADAAELVQALRAAACIAMLALSPSERVPHQVDCLACLTQSLQVADLLLHHMLHHTQYSKCCMLQRQLSSCSRLHWLNSFAGCSGCLKQLLSRWLGA